MTTQSRGRNPQRLRHSRDNTDRLQQRRPAGLLLSARRAEVIDRLLQRPRCSEQRGAGAQQQMRAASRREPTEEAQRRLVFLNVGMYESLGVWIV